MFDLANAIGNNESSLITSYKYIEICTFGKKIAKFAIAYSEALLV